MFPPLTLSPCLPAAATVSLAAFALACSGPAATPTTAPTKPTSPPAAASSPAAAPAASPAVPASSPAAASSPAGVAPASSTGAQASGSSTAANVIRFVFEPGTNEMRYRARETFSNQPAPTEAVGATKQMAGAVVITNDGAIVPDQSKITVDLSTLTSDRRNRDNFIKQNTLQTAQYPNAELVLREATDLLRPLPTTGADSFQLLGDLTVHGVTRPVQWDVQADFSPEGVTGTATTLVKITDFGMQTPRTASIISVEDDIRLELDFNAKRSS
jgi:polyisoprenoid-binding protein YceI